MVSDRTTSRLVFLEEVRLSHADLESIVAELEEIDRALQEIEAFAEGMPWPWLPVQP